MPMALRHPSHRRILSLDGGGLRGLSSLLVVERIMEETGKIAGRNTPVRPCEVFDMICGSSTGGLIALLLGRLGLECSVAIEAYKNIVGRLMGEEPQPFWDRLLSGSGDHGSDKERQYEEQVKALVGTYGGTSLFQMPSPGGQHCKVLVPLSADSPYYTGMINQVRSYPTPAQASNTMPLRHEWSIYEVARATLAQPFVMQPLSLEQNGKHSTYGDAGTSGFNNPTLLAYREASRLWNAEEVGVIVSVGCGLRVAELRPQNPTRDWSPTDRQLQCISGPIALKKSHEVKEETAKVQSEKISKYLLSIAADSELVHLNILEAVSALDREIYQRLDPPLAFLDEYLAHQKTEVAVKAWLDAPLQNEIVGKIASKLVLRAPRVINAPRTVEEARTLDPPPPPVDTNPGYNPQLDKKRPQDLTHYLREFEVIFVIDDSQSMYGDLWQETSQALVGIINHARAHPNVGDAIHVHFFNSPVVHVEGQDSITITQLFTQVQPTGRTPTGAVLKRVLDPHIRRLDLAIGTPEYSDIKPLDVIVITDGKPDDRPQDVIIQSASHLKTHHHHPNSIGIQFVQVGSDSNATSKLQELVEGDNGNMVDTVPYSGVLDFQKLERILLGALHPNVRALLPRETVHVSVSP